MKAHLNSDITDTIRHLYAMLQMIVDVPKKFFEYTSRSLNKHYFNFLLLNPRNKNVARFRLTLQFK